jgi:hypothetical protein
MRNLFPFFMRFYCIPSKSLLRNYLPVLLIAFFSVQLPAQENLTKPNITFKTGELLSYKVVYNSGFLVNFTAGYATIEVKDHDKPLFGREVWQIIGEGSSRKAFDWFFKVRNRYESFVDKETLLPHLFVRRTREGGYVKNDDVYFYHQQGYAVSRTAQKEIPENVHDFVSALFFMRTLEVDNFSADSSYFIDFFLDDSVYVSKVKYLGIENIRTRLGTFRCLKFAPMMATGNVFADAYPMHVWVTDDQNKLPVLAQAKVIVGSIKMELTDYQMLRNPLKSLIKKP